MKFAETGQIYVIILGIASYILFSYCMYYIWWYHLLPWKTLQGEIKEVTYEKHTRNILMRLVLFPIFLFSGELSLFRYWSPRIEYSFELKNKNYQSDRIRKPDVIYNTEDKAKEFISKYYQGQKIDIYYIERKPEYSMLVYKPERFKYLFGATISAMIFIPTIIVYLELFL